MMRVHRAIANRINIWVAAAARRIDDNPIIDAEPGPFREFRVGNKTDANQHKIGGKGLPTRAKNIRDISLFGCKTINRDAGANINASLVIQKNSMSYELPITGEFTAEAIPPVPEKWQRFLSTLLKHKRARISIRSVLYCDGQQVGELEGDFVAIVH